MVHSHLETDKGGLTLRNGSDRNAILRNELSAGLGSGLLISDSDGNVARRNFGFFSEFLGGLNVWPGSDNTTLERNELRGKATAL